MTETDNAARYAEKMKRVMDAVELRQPDRVPVAFFSSFWLARYGGITCRDLMFDFDQTFDLCRRAVLELDPDLFLQPEFQLLGRSIEALGLKQLEWPGHGVGDNHSFQFIDREYMTADEYDDFLFDPTGFYLNKYLPRTATAFEGLAELPPLPGHAYLGLVGIAAGFAHPVVAQSLASIHKAGEEAHRFGARMGEFIGQMAALGYPHMFSTLTITPFDFFGDYFRGARGILTDIRRRPEKLMEAMEKAGVFLLRHALKTSEGRGNNFVFIPIHWGPDNFMSVQQFKSIWWPPFRKMLLELIEHGRIPVVLWEADCTSRLEIIGDGMPRGKMVYWFERTDLVRAKEVLGDVVCLRGNVSPSVLTAGSPEDVDAACRHLIEKVGKNGGFILDAAIGIPDESPVENVRALFRSVHKYSA
jgi:uroporphyrinogen-III decarboxylase